MEERLQRRKLFTHLCIAMTGGCFGGYSVLRLGHFASSATVNLIEVFTSGAQGDLRKSLLRASVVLFYALALFLASALPGRTGRELRPWAILLDGLTAVSLWVLPEGMEHAGTCLCIFTMAFQWAVFADGRGYPCSTIFSANNLRQFIDGWVKVRLEGDESQRPRMRIYGQTLLCFHTGVFTVCLLWWLGLGHGAILVSLIPTALAMRWTWKTEWAR